MVKEEFHVFLNQSHVDSLTRVVHDRVFIDVIGHVDLLAD